MKHTQLTVRNFTDLSGTVFAIMLVSVGAGAIDLLMIAPKGLDHVAAAGQGELIVTAAFAFFIGLTDTFSSRLAMAEGQGTSAQRLPVLAGAFLLALVPAQVLAVVVVLCVEPLLTLIHQDPALVPLVGDYTAIRIGAVCLALVHVAVAESLKICGLKRVAMAAPVVGLGINAMLNWLFLYTDLSRHFSSPESAVTASTVGVQLVLAAGSLVVFLRQMRLRAEPFERPDKGEMWAEFSSMVRTAPGIGVRHLNDWAGAVVPTLFIGTLGVEALAATVVATKIYTVFCRVPQSCVSGAFIFYSYAVGRDSPDLAKTARRLLVYIAVPTGLAALLLAAAAYSLVDVFGSGEADARAALWVLLAFMLPLPFYVLSAGYGEMLTVHQRGGLMSVWSTVTTYAIAIPLAWYAVSVWESPALAIALAGLQTPILAYVFGRALRKDHWSPVIRPVPQSRTS
ncbi:MATE family efflux transporter [Streptomyces sp. NPDC013171]|uniref:MATE family efflux transporter n=1 Tax=Streptomyces sp. NPDC013171 TaxID=3364863 RepID=UPI0036B04FF1